MHRRIGVRRLRDPGTGRTAQGSCRSKREELNVSKCFPVYPTKRSPAGPLVMSRLVFVGNLLDQLNDGQPQAIMINSPECLQQPIGMWPGELVKNQLLVGVRHLITALEQGRDRNIQKRCDLQQSPATNPISPLLVFLDLLERQTEFISKLCLSEPLLQTINPDIAANNSVDRVRPFACHHKPSSSLTTKPTGQYSRCEN